MTYDKLLERIDEEGEFLVQHFDSKPKVHSALRAVVELHKPQSEYYPNTNEGIDVGYDFKLACRQCSNLYPCQTIKAIEKELS